MYNPFSHIPRANIGRSSFRRPSKHSTTLDADYLYPVFVDEVLPGDTFKLNTSMFGRLATPIKPSMDNIRVDLHFFFVPNRLVWDNFENFMGDSDATDGIKEDYLIPHFPFDGSRNNSCKIFDYFGLPIRDDVAASPADSAHVNALPFRAYNKIYNEWYRDENLISEVKEVKGDIDNAANYTLLKRNKAHDYFTSALPWPQKGSAVSIPLSGDVVIKNKDEGAPTFRGDDPNHAGVNIQFEHRNGANADVVGMSDISGILHWDDPKLVADLSTVDAVTINQLREAIQLQAFLERDARGGTRYVELIRAHFGVTNPDYRLQRSEYLGGTRAPVKFTQIAQTSATPAGQTNNTPQANVAAVGTVDFGDDFCFNKSFTEHGYILGIASVVTDIGYQQTLHKMWSRKTRYDFYWPEFAHLGEQAVLNQEIHWIGNHDHDSGVFGYQERWSEYRYGVNRISGKFRSTDPQSLDVWHYVQEFSNPPALNKEFIEYKSPVKRNSSVPSEPDFIMDFYFDLNCIRPMPMYSTPGFMSRF